MATTPSHRGDKGSAPCRQRPVISRPLSLNDFFIVAKYELGAILPELVVWSLQRLIWGIRGIGLTDPEFSLKVIVVMRPCDGTSGLVRGNRRKAVFAFKGS